MFNPLTVRLFTVFGNFLEERLLHKGAWFATLLDTHLRIKDHKKVKFPGQDVSSLAVNSQLSGSRG